MFLANIFKSIIIREAVNIWKNQCNGRIKSSNHLFTQFDLYRNENDSFNDLYIKNISTPINWWTSVELKKGEDPIKKFALRMHGIIPYNADCKKVFSILG